MSANSNISRVLLAPIVSEKTTMMSGGNVAAFWVATSATKLQIKAAVEKYLGAKVEKINTVNKRANDVTFGRTKGKTKRAKKAYITLAEGSAIADYSSEQ